MAHPEHGPAYAATLDGAFEGYAELLPRVVEHVGARVPDDPAVPAAARDRAIRAAALDLLRGLLPAATTANVGVFGPARPTRRCSSGWAPTRCPRRASAPRPCCASCARSSRRS